MNAYDMYFLGDTFKNDNGEEYIILAMNKKRDKALLCTKGQCCLCIGASGLREHHWCYGHYFMENFDAGYEWYIKDDNIPDEKEKEKFLYLFTYEIMPRDKSSFIHMNCQKYFLAHNFIEAREALFKLYTDSDDMITDYQYEIVPFYDITENEED